MIFGRIFAGGLTLAQAADTVKGIVGERAPEVIALTFPGLRKPVEVVAFALSELAQGKTYTQVCRNVEQRFQIKVDRATVWRWWHADPERSSAWAAARTAGLVDENVRLIQAYGQIMEEKLDGASLNQAIIGYGVATDKLQGYMRIAQQERVNNSWTAALKRVLAMPQDDRKALVAGILNDGEPS